MKCKLCNRNTQCPCKGGGCPQCRQSNIQVEYTNKVIDLGTDKKVVLENLESMKLWQRLRIDPFLIWDKLTNRTEFPDDVKEAIENNKPLGNNMPKHKVYIKRTNETDFVPRKNPNRECNFGGDKSPWARCVFCNSIKRYMNGKECPSFNLENKEEDVQ